ncbi:MULTISPECIES: zinc piracy TonB-dependent receptor ZnuD [unclassified Acinetobacter]|uniref:zinc piracy TonB-dependent receptor ZnuD n=1 Tax=unclassified Acinetobacter TaxID=196816 RepID=UPI0029351252|nr:MULTISPECIES: zinc piracy TonB-dependent receptor ZnuD [unclassified Acinetobacter]WOE31284.1 zinc piracy TonB-dependent receptor ZnuD [Acinetobacter sp. SAAs470]WOE39480.1 zinc piracy TonB-dependent receptor ZnuD [Acinetobacter sp. SAAs474]
MYFNKNLITLTILSLSSSALWADTALDDTKKLATIQLQAHPLIQTPVDFAALDHVIDQSKLSQGASTIGEALGHELGISSNQFGAGSSRPVIRGQDGPRVKVLQHASEPADVSALSPDHAITVDPILAQQIEIIRGPSTLLYGAGTVGGLVNVTDQKIPTQMPAQGYEGKVALRYNSGSDEKLAAGGVTVGLGQQFALRLEGLKRHANDYITPNYQQQHDGHVDVERRVPDTFAKGETFSIGSAWIGERGFIGAAYTHRQDQYGLPGHSHEYESCHPHANTLYCGDHGHGHEHGHDDEETDSHEHDAGPWVNLKSKRYDVRAELTDPLQGWSKLRVHSSYTDYQHDEIDQNIIGTTFKSKAYDGRVELVHQPVAGWEGVIGTQYNQQKLDITGTERLLNPTQTRKWSVFALEHKRLNDFYFELGARADQQQIKIDSNQKDNNDHALSASAAVSWQLMPDYTLSLTGSHQQRLPLAQELYANGIHLATNTYERGNENLDVEKSNNLEIGWHYAGEQLDYHLNVYHNWYQNYIYAATTAQQGNFRLVDYTQDKAQFYGAEAQASYQLTDAYKLSVFGDMVRGKIDGQNAPRVPAGRLGTKVNVDFFDGWKAMAEYYHAFKQDRISAFEQDTPSYEMVNLGLSYQAKYGVNQDYRVYFNANNLLDQEVYQHASFLANIPQVGRNFTIGVEFGF